ncbi:MAG: hypothetical protein ACJ8FY_27195 [Gemmataceae bacterium]
MIENQDARDHWKELAEQLGLPPEPEGNATAPVQPESPRVREAEQEDQEETANRKDRRELEPVEEQSRSRPPYSREPEEPVEPNEFPPIEEDIEAPLQPETPELEELPSALDESAEEEEGGRNDDEKQGAVAAQEEEPSRGRRRRGGRGGKRPHEGGRPEGKRGRGREVAAKPKAEIAEKKPAPADEEEADDMEDLSNWTVPSWQELISSLYRPDR